ncbi:unnamed protein product [Urochloa humidicola]
MGKKVICNYLTSACEPFPSVVFTRPQSVPRAAAGPRPPPTGARALRSPRPAVAASVSPCRRRPAATASVSPRSIPRGHRQRALVADPRPAPAGSSIAAELHHHESRLKVYLQGGQVTFWKNNFGQQLLFVSNK